jgi:hypothetical protein
MKFGSKTTSTVKSRKNSDLTIKIPFYQVCLSIGTFKFSSKNMARVWSVKILKS